METEGRWIDNLDGKSPTIDQQRNYHDFGCTDHSIKKVTDEADRLLEEFGDDLVRSHVEKYLKEAIENAVNASHRTTRKSFFVGAAEAFVGALFWTLTLFLASILAERVGIDLLETYKRVSGHS
jgi:hypothetical protein